MFLVLYLKMKILHINRDTSFEVFHKQVADKTAYPMLSHIISFTLLLSFIDTQQASFSFKKKLLQYEHIA